VRLLRAVLARLDPWAALLLGILVALAVVILLATPGPWHRVVGPAPTKELSPPPPTDVAVYALGGPHGACSAVVWVHVDQASPSMTTVVVAPPAEGFLSGAGFMPLARMVDAAGPAAATTALSQALGVHMDAWLSLDAAAVRMAMSAAEPAGPGLARVAQYRGAASAWTGTGSPRTTWLLQTDVLARNLVRVPFARTSVIGFANYVLGFGHIRSDLDLQQATSLAATLKLVQPAQVGACAAPVVIESCRGGRAWRVSPDAAAQLRRDLAAGRPPQQPRPLVTRSPSPARVLVVLPGSRPAARRYVAQVRRSLAASAAAPVAVKAITVTAWPRLAARTVAAARRWKPLAVLVGPPVMSPGSDTADAAKALRVLGVALRINWLPAVMSEPFAVESSATAAPQVAELQAAVGGGPQPVAPLPPASVDASALAAASTTAAALAARANVATLVRACWSETLAPRLASTRLRFSFAARRRTVVGVFTQSAAQTATYLARLQTWGYQVRPMASGSGLPQLTGEAVLYRPGLRRAALALAGDLGLAPTALAADAESPAPLALVVT
jgi:hypothetical protein